MPTVDINYLAVLATALVTMAVGCVWYSLEALGKTRVKELDLDLVATSIGVNTSFLGVLV